MSTRLLSSQPRLELQAGKKAGTPKQRRVETLYALAFCFGDESILPKTKPFITELDIHTNDRSQNKLKEGGKVEMLQAQLLLPTNKVS